MAAILANPRYTGRQVWNRQRTDFDLADPANTTLGHKQVHLPGACARCASLGRASFGGLRGRVS